VKLEGSWFVNETFVKSAMWVPTAAAAVGAGLIGGVFFAFSSFVMKGLGRLPAPQAISAMQSINITVINPLFLGVFLGTGVCSVVLAIYSLPSLRRPDGLSLLAGCLIYLLGSIGTTMVFNVPLNNALAAADPASADAAAVWARYESSWSLWHHVRAVASVLAAVAFVA
jgi:uncharacterized membrane protein